MAIFMKLFVISIVARSLSGAFSTLVKRRYLFEFFAAISDWSDGESEKYATSDPDANAEPTSRIIIQINLPVTDGVTG